jgi:DNA-binding PadR family transcriptional regulator
MKMPRLSTKEALILEQLIGKGEMYGLELVKASNGELKRGTVYVTLSRMEDKGFVESREAPPDPVTNLKTRVYRATGHGQRVFQALEMAQATLAMEGV